MSVWDSLYKSWLKCSNALLLNECSFLNRYLDAQMLRYSNAQLLKCSNISAQQMLSFQDAYMLGCSLLKCSSNAPMLWCLVTLMVSYSNSLFFYKYSSSHWCFNAQMLGCLDARMLWCLDAWMLGCLDALIFRCLDS